MIWLILPVSFSIKLRPNKSWFGITCPILKFARPWTFLKIFSRRISDGFSWDENEFLYSVFNFTKNMPDLSFSHMYDFILIYWLNNKRLKRIGAQDMWYKVVLLFLAFIWAIVHKHKHLDHIYYSTHTPTPPPHTPHPPLTHTPTPPPPPFPIVQTFFMSNHQLVLPNITEQIWNLTIL